MLPIAFTEPVTSTQSNPRLHGPSPTPCNLFFFSFARITLALAPQRISHTFYWQLLGNCEGTIWFAMLLSEWISVLVSRVFACTVSAQRKPMVCLAIVSLYCGICVMISYIARLNRNQTGLFWLKKEYNVKQQVILSKHWVRFNATRMLTH